MIRHICAAVWLHPRAYHVQYCTEYNSTTVLGYIIVVALLRLPMTTVIRADILRHLCKEPLAEVESLHLRGWGIGRLEGLHACPNLTSLDVSRNGLTKLDEACFGQGKELWIIDASHNRIVRMNILSCSWRFGDTTRSRSFFLLSLLLGTMRRG